MYSYFSNQTPIVLETLLVAAKEGRVDELVAELATHKHNQTIKDTALATAACWGQLECVRVLSLHTDACANDSLALRNAAQFGQTQCVIELIPLSNPKDLNSNALFLACEYEYNDCIDALYAVSDVVQVLCNLKKEYPDTHSKWEYLQQKHEADVLHKALCSTVSSKTPSSTKKM